MMETTSDGDLCAMAVKETTVMKITNKMTNWFIIPSLTTSSTWVCFVRPLFTLVIPGLLATAHVSKSRNIIRDCSVKRKCR